MKTERTRLWLCLPFVVVFLIDGTLTLAGQSALYWSGDRSVANEGFPVFAWGLSVSPWMFGLVGLGWVAAFSALIMAIPRLPAQILALALVNGHTWGAMTWFAYRFRVNYHICLLYFLFTATLFVLSYRRSRHPQPAGQSASSAGI